MWRQKARFSRGAEAPAGPWEPRVSDSSQARQEHLRRRNWPILQIRAYSLNSFQTAGFLAHHWVESLLCHLLCVFGQVSLPL